jgi:hypothetical protein
MRYFVPCIYMCMFLLCSHAALAQCPSPVPLSITNVLTTESQCQASGTAEVQLNGGTAPFVYSITSGPVQFPGQSSNHFQSLPPGNYIAQVVDNCGTTRTTNFSITGSYSVPQPNHFLTAPTCPGNSDGRIEILVSDGRPPFTYSLISPSPVTAGPQAGNDFTNLPGGVYTYEVTDSCGNFQTRTVTLPDGNDGAFNIERGVLHYEACDSFSIPYRVWAVDPSYIRTPYTFTLTLPDGTTKTHVINTTQYIAGYIIRDTFHFRYHHQPGALDPIPINGTNNCGYSTLGYGYMDMLNMFPNRYNVGNCTRDLYYAFEPAADNSPSAVWQFHCNTITYTLYSPAGALLASQTNNSVFSGYPAGNNYKVVREDCCMKDSINFNWQQRPTLQINNVAINPGDACKEGAAGIDISINNLTLGSIILASGPPSITFGDGTVHNYVYPDTMTNMPFGSTGVRINYFGAGTYTIYAVDTCGERDTATFTITPAQLRHSSYTASIVRGCINDNRIVMNAQSNGGQWDATISANWWSYFPSSYPWKDSAINLGAGSYTTYYAYRSRITPWSFLTGMSGYACDTITHTLVVQPYTQPAFAMAPAVAVCGNNRFVALVPDSSRGVLPYRYQISAGATTTPLQTGNTFSGLSAGMYTFLIADGCGNSFSNSVAIDTLLLPHVAVTGTACLGSATTLSLPANPYYSYSWQHPNGSTTPGNSITMDPVTAAHLGSYQITVNSNVNGCADNSTGSLQVNDCLVALPLRLVHFSGNRQGNNIVLKWKTEEEVNTSHFIVERSSDGVHFSAIQQVKTTGNTAGNYSAIDNQPLPGKLFYRLQMVDKDGKFTNSTIIIINSDENGLIVTPQLITNNSEIKVTYMAASQTAAIQVLGIDGKLWLTQPVAKGSLQTTIPTGSLAKGSYLLVYINNGKRTAVRVVKL